MTSVERILEERLQDPATRWSIGVFGALAEFQRDDGEPARSGAREVVTARGAIRLLPVDECRPVAYEPRSAKQNGRDFGVALCLPEAAARLQCREVLTELGPDSEAINETDRGAMLFDLGLGSPYGMFCVRAADETQIAKLKAGLGRPLLDPANSLFGEIARLSPHRVFMSRLGRIEVYQRIAAPGGATPEGPHTHLLPKLVLRKRTHSANALLPQGLVPCATYYPVRGEHR
jgi:hypothetical protein